MNLTNCESDAMPSALLAEPTWHTAPPYTATLGPEVADLGEAIGFTPYPEQRMFLDDLFAVGAGGKSAAFESVLVSSRQQMKTGALKLAALGWLFVTDQKLVVWSAHEFSTASEALRDIAELIDGSAMLSRRVKEIYTGNSKPSIELMSGARLMFKARTTRGGRGLTGHKVILDEAFALQPSHMGALLPTMASPSVPDGQVVYASSAGMATSDVLRAVRDRGREGGSRLAYQEHCAPHRDCEINGCEHSTGTPGCALDDRELWAIANPVSYRHDPLLPMVAELRAALPPSEFMRECLCWWDDPHDMSLAGIDVVKWTELHDPNSSRVGSIAIGLDMAPDRSAVNIAVVGRREDGQLHGELIESRGGAHWVVERLVELNARQAPTAIVVDPYGAISSLVGDMTRAGLRLELLDATKYATACGQLHDAVEQGRIRHLGQHQLDAAVAGAKAHTLQRGGWVWRPRGDVSISPLVALTNALHGFEAGSANDITQNVW